MKVEEPLFTFSEGFSLGFITESMNRNKISLTDHGAIISFVCPTSIPINGKMMSCKSALNICYAIPTTTPTEMAYFQLLFNSQVVAVINAIMPDEHVASSSTVVSKNNNLCGMSVIGGKNGFGFGWHTLFLTDFQNTGDLKLEHINLPESKEGEPPVIDAVHTSLQNVFDIIRSHATNHKLSLALEK